MVTVDEYTDMLEKRGHQVKYLVDLSLVKKDDLEEVVKLLVDAHKWQGERVDVAFLQGQPLIMLYTDLLSAKEVAEEFGLVRTKVSFATGRPAEKSLEKFFYFVHSIQNIERGEETTYQHPDYTVADVEEISSDEMEDTINALQTTLSLDVYDDVQRNTLVASRVTEEQLNTVINSVVKQEVTTPKVKEVIVEEKDVELLEQIKEKSKLPTKVETTGTAYLRERVATQVYEAIEKMPGAIVGWLSDRNTGNRIVRPVPARRMKEPKKEQGSILTMSSSNVDVYNENLNMIEDDSSDDENYKSFAKDYKEVNMANLSGYKPGKATDKVPNACIPRWHFGTSQAQQYIKLENFIGDLTRFKDLGFNIPDATLIFMSLNQSDRSHMMSEIPGDCLTDLNKFVEHIKLAYGRNTIALREELNNVKKGEAESYFSYMQKILTLYYRSRKEEAKTLTYLKENKDSCQIQINDIIHYFLRGLPEGQVKRQLRMEIENVDIVDIAQKTKQIELALGESTTAAQVNAVDVGLQKEVEEIKKEVAQIVKNTHLRRDFNGKKKTPFTGRTEKKCYKCGLRGHLSFQCRKRSDADQNKHWRKPYNAAKWQPSGQPKKTPIKCYRCGKNGHRSDQCKVKLGRPMGNTSR